MNQATSVGNSSIADNPSKPSVSKSLNRRTNPNELLKSLKTGDKGKQKKPTVLEQATSDWNRCKAEENLEDELKQATKSKTGYLDKLSFLHRSDLRQFEKEREIRDKTRAKAALDTLGQVSRR